MSAILSRITGPADLHTLTDEQLAQLAQEMRDEGHPRANRNGLGCLPFD